MQFNTIDLVATVDVFLLLLIGIGPKIALVPFLKVTARMDDAMKARVVRKMVTTAATVALLLIVFGEILRRLLHFTTGALGVAGGLILVIIAVRMVLDTEDPKAGDESLVGAEPMKAATFPLAVPYLLNPAGIVALITLSAEVNSIGVFVVYLLVLASVLLIDVVVFRWASRVSMRLDVSRMLVTEKVFGFLLAALGVQLVLDGLSEVGVIHLIGH